MSSADEEPNVRNFVPEQNNKEQGRMKIKQWINTNVRWSEHDKRVETEEGFWTKRQASEIVLA